MAITKTQGKFSKGIDDGADANAITIGSDEDVTFTGGVKLDGRNASIGLKLDMAGSDDYVIKESSSNDIMQYGGGAASAFYHNISSGSVRLGTAGGGISFNGDTAAANALDDYEEGTWTPTYVPTSGSFGSISYGTRVGYYTKIGDLVTAHCRLDTSSMSIGSAGGYLLVGSLPFTCHGSAYQSITIGYCYGYSTVYATAGSTGTGMTAVYLYNTGRRNNSESIYPNNLGTGGTNLYMSVTYKTT